MLGRQGIGAAACALLTAPHREPWNPNLPAYAQVLFLSQCVLITPKRVVAGSVRLTPRQLHFVGDAPDERGGEGRAAGRPARTHRHWELAAMAEVRGPCLSYKMPWYLLREQAAPAALCCSWLISAHPAHAASLACIRKRYCGHWRPACASDK